MVSALHLILGIIYYLIVHNLDIYKFLLHILPPDARLNHISNIFSDDHILFPDDQNPKINNIFLV